MKYRIIRFFRRIAAKLGAGWRRGVYSVLRHPIRSFAAFCLLGAILTGMSEQLLMPANLFGIPSVYWAPEGVDTGFANGSVLHYLTEEEKKGAFSSYYTPQRLWDALVSESPDPVEDEAYDICRFSDAEEPYILCKAKVLYARDMAFRKYYENRMQADLFLVPPYLEEGYLEMDASEFCVVFLQLQEVLFDPEGLLPREGSIVTALASHYSGNYGLTPGSLWYCSLYPYARTVSDGVRDDEYYQDSICFKETHADFKLYWGYEHTWPVIDGKVLSRTAVTKDIPYERRYKLSDYDPKYHESYFLYPQEEFSWAVKEKLESYYEDHMKGAAHETCAEKDRG